MGAATGVDITFDATGGCARVLADATVPPIHLHNVQPPVLEPMPKRRGRARDFGLVEVSREEAFEYVGAEFIASSLQPETAHCNRVSAKWLATI